MKRKTFLFAILSFFLTLTCVATASSKPATQTFASDWEDESREIESVWRHTGFLEKVTDPSTIQDNEELLLVGDENATFDYVWAGNYHDYVSANEDRIDLVQNGIMYLQNEVSELITFEKEGDNFYLHLKHYYDSYQVEGSRGRSGYLAHDDAAHDYVTAYGGLAIKSSKDNPSKAASTWELSYVDGHMRITTAEEGDAKRMLRWKAATGYNSDAFICYSHPNQVVSNVDLYRPMKDVTSAANMTENPSSRYSKHDVINTSEIGVYLSRPKGGGYDIINMPISEYPTFYNIDTVVDYDTSGAKARSFTFKPYNTVYNFNINVLDSKLYRFTRVNSVTDADLRGTYLAIAESANLAMKAGHLGDYQSQNGGAIPLGDNSSINTGSGILETSNSYLYTLNDKWSSAFQLVHCKADDEVREADTLYARTIPNSAPENGGSYFGYVSSDEPGSRIKTAVKEKAIVSGSNLVIHGLTLRYDPTTSGNYPNGYFVLSDDPSLEAAKLYRLDLNTDTLSEATTFRTNYFDYYIRSKCDANGVSSNYSEWASTGTYFYTRFSPDCQRYFSTLTYVPFGHADATDESMTNCYDYMVRKYSLSDWMFRQNAGTLVIYNDIDSAKNGFSTLASPDNSVAIIAISAISLLGIAAIGAIFILRRKRSRE